MRLGVLMSLDSPWSREVVSQLSNLGIEVHAIDFTAPNLLGDYLDRSMQVEEINKLEGSLAGVHRISTHCRHNIKHLEAVPKIRVLSRKHGIDMFLTLYGGGRALTAYLSGIRPYVVFICGDDVQGLSGVRRFMAKAPLGAANIVFANGTHLATNTKILAPGARVEPLLLGVDTDRFVPGQGLEGPVRIICSRGFLPVYNNEYIVQGLAAIKEYTHDFTLWFLSGGSLLTTVKALANDLLSPSMKERVRFLGGVTEREMLEHLQGGDIFVSVSKSDGTATSMLEAMACGLFPVLSDIPPNREWVNPDAGNGMLVPLNNPTALANALVRAISDRPMREKAAVMNRRIVIERANSKRNMALLAERMGSLI